MQTTFSQQPALGISGTLVTEDTALKDSAIAASAVTPGRYVVIDSNGKCFHPTSAGAITAATRFGLAIRNMYMQNDGVYQAGENVDVLTDGEMYCDAEGATTQNGAVFVRHTSGGGGTLLGKLRHDADTSTALAIAGLYYRSVQAGAGTAIVSIRRSAA